MNEFKPEAFKSKGTYARSLASWAMVCITNASQFCDPAQLQHQQTPCFLPTIEAFHTPTQPLLGASPPHITACTSWRPSLATAPLPAQAHMAGPTSHGAPHPHLQRWPKMYRLKAGKDLQTECLQM